jgi:hypothetical protein
MIDLSARDIFIRKMFEAAQGVIYGNLSIFYLLEETSYLIDVHV